MTVGVTQLIDPAGMLLPDMFPQDADADAFTARVQGYLAKAATQAAADGVTAGDLDAAVEAYALYLALSVAATTRASMAQSVTVTNEGSRMLAPNGWRSFDALAQAQLQTYARYVPAPVPATAAEQLAASRTVAVRFRF